MKHESVSSLRLIMLGAGGHASVLHALALSAGHRITGVCAPELAASGAATWRGVPVLGDDTALANMDPSGVGLINGVGQLVGSRARQTVYGRMKGSGFRFPALIHPTAWVADSVGLKDGVQVMAGVIIQPDSTIGENSIVNTNASIDHDCIIGRHVHIAPGATLCGGVSIGDGAFIGAGSTVIQNMAIGKDAIVGAGAVVIQDLESGTKLIGAAMRRMNQDQQYGDLE